MYKKCFKGRSIFLVLPVVEVNFLGIKPQLKDVVAQGKERSEGEGADKDGDEAKLDNHLQVLGKQERVRGGGQGVVLHAPVSSF